MNNYFTKHYHGPIYDCDDGKDWFENWGGISNQPKFDFIYMDPPYFVQKDFGEFDDRWEDIEEYCNAMKDMISFFPRFLTDTGTACVHVDWRTTHYIRSIMDHVFGFGNFQNEIIWAYNSGGASKSHFSRKHDNLIVYSKDAKKSKFNVLREPYATPNVKGRPGFHDEGRIMNDVWNIPFISTTSKERTGYPTQKPEKLAERLIQAYTDPGDTVLDICCGSGTLGVVAHRMNRKVVFVDKNSKALDIAHDRVNSTLQELF